jgi:putative dimethyl sulfoxide reductase chaperone
MMEAARIARLTAEALVCGLLARTLYEAPEKAWIGRLIEEDVFAEIPFAGAQPDVRTGLALLREWSASQRGRLADDELGALEADFNRLFVGPAKVLAAPWESAYVERERMLFQRTTYAVRDWYARFGLERSSPFNEPEDHLGMELGFVAHLALAAAQALRDGNGDRAEELIDARQCFLAEHPLRWAPNWCRDVEKHARTGFYRGIARIIRGVMRELGTSVVATAGG